ncbi:hypothetical protein CK203_055440 [Vitis vinifera]|uniref:Uncharacterized protein n=1 Tax=Vitis vinifera TaxID=29760 RepID=A0A438GJF4_VITVI|nr:hypothetical protein CK203_055440 [Vitis vinifera]
MQKDEDEDFVNYIVLRCMVDQPLQSLELPVLKLSDVLLKACPCQVALYVFFCSRVQPLGSDSSIFQKRIFIADVRPVGAVTYMQQNNLKMCLRSTDSATDTSEVAKAYGGGGSPSSSSFIIRMDEYNQWLSVNSS